MDYGLNRTQRIEVRVSPEEYAILERVAKNKGVTVSDYLRWMAMWAAFKTGDRGTLRYVGQLLREEHRERMQRFYSALGLPDIGKKESEPKGTKAGASGT
jgi:uncharacterized protein (DUF1778 family)